jgi:hypothetical protein
MQHPKLGPGHQRLFRLAGPLAGVIKAEVDEGIQALVSGLDALDEGIDDLDRGQLPPPDPGASSVAVMSASPSASAIWLNLLQTHRLHVRAAIAIGGLPQGEVLEEPVMGRRPHWPRRSP